MTKLAVIFLMLISGSFWLRDKPEDAAVASLIAIIILLGRIMDNQRGPE